MIAILPFSGFTEKREFARGIEDLWVEVLLPMSGSKIIVYSPEVWSQDPRPILAELRRIGVKHLMLIGYSWGAGVGCIRTAQMARDYGVVINMACFCDPVYRSRWLPHWLPLNPLSLLRGQTIHVPPSIKEVRWVRQERDLPGGNNLKPIDGHQTLIHTPITLDTTHAHIDEHYHWKTLVKNAAYSFIHRFQSITPTKF